VVLIVVDTLRADRLPFYGCARNTAPFLDELAQRSLVFENAWSPSSWTLPATVSILTSVHPFQHRVASLHGLELKPGDEPVPVDCIPAEVETLAESMQRAGYRTFGIASNVLVGSAVGFDRGFDRFVRLEDEDADAVNASAASWRDEMLAERPFLYVHYFDPHDTFHARLADGEAPVRHAIVVGVLAGARGGERRDGPRSTTRRSRTAACASCRARTSSRSGHTGRSRATAASRTRS
jgi:arylsulfatase A-like enzyme